MGLLDYRISGIGHFFNRGDQDLFAKSKERLEGHLDILVEWIELEVASRGEGAMLKGFPLRSFLRRKVDWSRG